MDFSDTALYDLYDYESTGRGSVRPDNGFAQGKKMMDITVAMWSEDLGVTLWASELYADENLPNWWLDRVLGKSI